MNDGSIRIGTKLDLSGLKKEIQALEKELKTVQKEADKLTAKEEKVKETFTAEREIDSMVDKKYSHEDYIDKQEAEALAQIKAEREAINEKAQEYNAMLDQANAKLQQQSAIAQASKELDSAVKSEAILDKVTTQEQYNSLLEETRAKMAAIEAQAERIATTNGVSRDALLAANPAYQKLSDTMSVLENTTRQFGNEAQDAGEKASRGLRKARKESNNLGASISAGIKKFGKMALAIFSIRSAYSAVRMAVNEYLAVNERLKGQIETLKAGFGQVLGPAIEWIINLLMRAVQAVNTFVYALSGINFIAKANEAALKKQGKAASDTKNNLAGFDEQTKLSDSSGSGSTAGNLDATIGELSNFAENLKAKILAGDWYGAGILAGEKLVDGIESFDWAKVGEKIGEILGGALSFVLGFAVSFDPTTIREGLSKFFSSAFTAITEEIQKIDWYEVGENLLDYLLLGLAWLNPFSAIASLFFTPNDEELTRSTSELLGAIIGGLAAAIVGLGTRIEELATQLWDSFKSYFDDYVDWGGTGEDIAVGLLLGIIDALANVGQWIYDNIWIPFRDAFKKAFGIHSPSTKMAEFGVYMMEGLKNGITSAISRVTNACKEIWNAIKSVFSSVGTWFKDTFSNAWQKVKDVFSTGGKIFDGIKDGIASTFKTIVNGLIGGINKVIAVPFNTINGMLNTIRGISILGVSPFKGLWSYNPLSVPQIPKLAVGGIVNRPGRGVPAIIGEAGAEAVLPLENNTEWMDILAEKIGGNVTIPIILDGKKIATYVVDIQKKKAFAMNGA